VFDGSGPLQREDRDLLAAPPSSKRIVVLNKSDLPQRLDVAEIASCSSVPPIRVSAVAGDGLENLEEAILRMAYPVIPPDGAAVVFTDRQDRLMAGAIRAIESEKIDVAEKALDRVTRERPASDPRR